MKTCYIALSAGVLATASAVRVEASSGAEWKLFKNISKAVKNAVEDAIDTAGDVVDDVADFFEEDVADFFTDDLPSAALVAINWVTDGSNWEALGTTLVTSSALFFTGETQASWEMFTDPEMYWGDSWENVAQNEDQLAAWQAACAALEPGVGELGESGWNSTSDFTA